MTMALQPRMDQGYSATASGRRQTVTWRQMLAMLRSAGRSNWRGENDDAD
jgi:hypothetical protein